MSQPTITERADRYVVDCPQTGTVAAWPTVWHAEFHIDLLNNGVAPSQAVAQTIANGDLPDEAF